MSGVGALVDFAQGVLMPKKQRNLKDIVLGNVDQVSGMKDVRVQDFELKAFYRSGCMAQVIWLVSVVFTFSYAWVIASDVYALYSIAGNELIPRRILYAYIAFFCIGLIIFLMEMSYAREILAQGDISQIMIDDLSYNVFQARGFCEYGLIRQVQKRLSITDLILIRCVVMMENMRRILLVTLPETIILVIAVLYKNGILSDPGVNSKTSPSYSVFIYLIPYIIKFYVLITDIKDMILLLFVYPCLRCTILLTTKKNLSLKDYINLRVGFSAFDCLNLSFEFFSLKLS
jgi:hypothetical protein